MDDIFLFKVLERRRRDSEKENKGMLNLTPCIKSLSSEEVTEAIRVKDKSGTFVKLTSGNNLANCRKPLVIFLQSLTFQKAVNSFNIFHNLCKTSSPFRKITQ